MNIVIVGGGTAGWLSALIISNIFKNVHDVTLIESSEIKSIGVGEGSTGFLRGIVNNEIWDFGCNQYDFMNFSKATPKLGVFFKDWKNLKNDYMEPIDGPSDDSFESSSPTLLKNIVENKPIHLASINGNFMENQKSPFIKLEGNNFLSFNCYSFHFDAKLAAKYFEERCIDKVKKIDSTIEDIEFDGNGFVKNIILKNNLKIYGDFFIDASGFSRIFAKKMSVNFIKFDELTLNSAIPFVLDKKIFSNENFYTTAWAKKYGWMWMIPKEDSIGCGYIYDDHYIDEFAAKKEIEDDLKVEINIIKKINFEAGRQENLWNKNVLSVGLSSHFLEPLEATSIHGTIAQLYNFAFNYLKKDLRSTVNEHSISQYNKETIAMIENFKNFILFHYASSRRDTDFWKSMNRATENNNFIKEILDISKTRLLNKYDFFVPYGGSDHTLFNWVVAGMQHIDPLTAQTEIEKPKKIDQFNLAQKEITEFMINNDWLNNKDFIKLLNKMYKEDTNE